MDGPFPAYRGEAPYVFVCYAHDDAATVYPELDWLRRQGINIWYDEGISAGQIWRAEIAHALDNATEVLFYVSAAALVSDHCNREINYALDKGCAVLPVYLEDVELTPDLQIGLTRVQALHRDDDGSYRVHLMEALHRVLDDLAVAEDIAEAAEEGDAAVGAPTAEPAAPGARGIEGRRRARLHRIIVAAAALVGLVLWFWPENPSMPPPETDTTVSSTVPSIAVLPFANLSGDPENEYFSDGVAEEILNALSGVESLRVAARTSAFSFKGRNLEVQRIGEALQVAHVLEGSVRWGGEQVRIQVQLIDATTGFQLWSESFDRKLEDIFAVQDEIAGAVARALKVELAVGGPEPGVVTTNLEAYNAFLKGRSLLTYADERVARTAIGYFKRAVELDPEYGAAYGALALQYALISIYRPIDEIQTNWETAFNRALELNPDDVNALVAKAHYVTRTAWNWKQADGLYMQAVELGIPASATILYGQHLWALGDLDRLWSAYEQALSTDPYNFDILWDYALQSTISGEGERALELWDQILGVEPDYVDAWVGKAYALAVLGEHEAAAAQLARVDVQEMNPFMWHPYLLTLLLTDEKEAARSHMKALEGSNESAIRTALMWVYAQFGEVDRALDAYEGAYQRSEFGAMSIRNPGNQPLHGEPRYEALLEQMNLDDASLRSAGLR